MIKNQDIQPLVEDDEVDTVNNMIKKMSVLEQRINSGLIASCCPKRIDTTADTDDDDEDVSLVSDLNNLEILDAKLYAAQSDEYAFTVHVKSSCGNSSGTAHS